MSDSRQLKAQLYQPPGNPGPATEPNSTEHDTAVVWWRSQLFLMVLAFALLLLGAVLLTLFMPPSSMLSEKAQLTLVADLNSEFRDTTETREPSDLQLSPWDAEQRIEARAKAQTILSDLVSLKRSLQDLKVQEWNSSDFKAAQLLAEQGDDLYALQEYSEALTRYRTALANMRALEKQIPIVVNAYVSAANADIAEGRFELAEQNFLKALNLDPNHIPALAGKARLEVLPKVLSKIATADSSVMQYNDSNAPALLEHAIQNYQAALELDALAPLAEDKISVTKELLIEHRFNAAMSKAIQALIASKYSLAQQQFSAALNERPDYRLARQGLEQALALNESSSINGLFAQAKQLEKQEAWQSAQSLYEAILQRDASQVRARSALVQARVRAQLDMTLHNFITAPMTVTDFARRKKIEDAVQQAKGLSRQGPRLVKQIQKIETLLDGAVKNVQVSITSDFATTVYLLKRGAKPIKYEPFARKQLSLPPGRYALSGQRLGFRDVREDLLIPPNSTGQMAVDIRSRVAIGSEQGGRQ